MNAWQTAQQVRHLLTTARWSEGSADVVFGPRGVRIFAGSPSEDDHPASFPFALVEIGSANSGVDDALPSDATIYEQQINVVVACLGYGDSLGEQAIIGGPRPDYGYSEGAGLAELTERVLNQVGGLTTANGAPVSVTTNGTATVTTLSGNNRHVAVQELTLTCACTRAAFYQSPQHFRQAGEGLQWAGAGCIRRFDFQDFEVGYVTGSTPATSPGGAGWTQVATTTATNANVTPESGRTYSVFARYKPRGGNQATHYSHVEVGSYFEFEGG